MLRGMTFVISGKFSDGVGNESLKDSKRVAESFIRDNGGDVKSAISSKTRCLLIGQAPGASKISKAVKFAVPIINIEKLRKCVECDVEETDIDAMEFVRRNQTFDFSETELSAGFTFKDGSQNGKRVLDEDVTEILMRRQRLG